MIHIWNLKEKQTTNHICSTPLAHSHWLSLHKVAPYMDKLKLFSALGFHQLDTPTFSWKRRLAVFIENEWSLFVSLCIYKRSIRNWVPCASNVHSDHVNPFEIHPPQTLVRIKSHRQLEWTTLWVLAWNIHTYWWLQWISATHYLRAGNELCILVTALSTHLTISTLIPLSIGAIHLKNKRGKFAGHRTAEKNKGLFYSLIGNSVYSHNLNYFEIHWFRRSFCSPCFVSLHCVIFLNSLVSAWAKIFMLLFFAPNQSVYPKLSDMQD